MTCKSGSRGGVTSERAFPTATFHAVSSWADPIAISALASAHPQGIDHTLGIDPLGVRDRYLATRRDLDGDFFRELLLAFDAPPALPSRLARSHPLADNLGRLVAGQTAD